MSTTLNNRGDTIIEVVLSMALLTSILFISWSITNRATQVMLGARERTAMVNQVKEQAELIKSSWTVDQGFADLYTPAAEGDLVADPCQGYASGGWSVPGGQTWYLGINDLGATSPELEKKPGLKSVDNVSNGYVWVQRVVPTDPNNTGYADFYVRGCWINNSGSIQKTENTQVVVRLSS